MTQYLLEGVIVSWKPKDTQTTNVTLLVLYCTQVGKGKKWRFDIPPLISVLFDNRNHSIKQQIDFMTIGLRIEVLITRFDNGSYQAILQNAVEHKPRKLEDLLEAVEAVEAVK